MLLTCVLLLKIVKCLHELVNLLVDKYFRFDKSSCRKEEYHEFQDFTDTPHEVITKHMSLQGGYHCRRVLTALSQWDAFQSYFSSIKEAERPGRATCCKDMYTGHGVKLYYKFLSYALARLNSFNVLFQGEGCSTFHLLSETKALLRTYLARFVDNGVLNSAEDLI